MQRDEIIKLAESVGIPTYIEETETVRGYSIENLLVYFAKMIEEDLRIKLEACFKK